MIPSSPTAVRSRLSTAFPRPPLMATRASRAQHRRGDVDGQCRFSLAGRAHMTDAHAAPCPRSEAAGDDHAALLHPRAKARVVDAVGKGEHAEGRCQVRRLREGGEAELAHPVAQHRGDVAMARESRGETLGEYAIE